MQEAIEDILYINDTLCFSGNDNTKIIGLTNWRGDYTGSASYHKNDIVRDPISMNLYISQTGIEYEGSTGIPLNDTDKWQTFQYGLPIIDNVGTGYGVFKSSNLNSYNFKSINPGSNKLSLTNLSNQIDLDIQEPNININNLSGAPSGNVIGSTDSQTLTNKNIDADNNTISNITNNEIKTGAAIDATKIADGSVTSTEFQYLSSVTSNVQAQLNSKSSSSHTHTSTDITDFDSATDSRISIQKGAVNGLATLDNGGKIPSSQLNLNSVTYQGTWNALTNDPTIVSSTGTQGHYYVVNQSGFTNIDGIAVWDVGDWIIFNGTAWDKNDNSDQVTSVAGKQGAVTLAASDIISGTFANSRITSSNVTQHEGDITIGNLTGAPAGAVVGISDSQILTNKTINADSNTITNIDNADIKAAAAIDATKIANGSVTNTEFQYINSVTSNVQTQLDAKAASSHTHAATDVTSGTFADSRIAESNVTQHEGAITINNLIGAPTGTVVGISDSQILTNKTINADSNTITNIDNADIKAAAAIDATKIADGSVTNTEFQYINSVTSNVQTQLNAKAASSHTHAASAITSGTLPVSRGGIGTNTLASGKILRGNGTSAITATLNAPSGSIVGTTDSQTLSNKTIDADSNTITNIDNADIKTAAAIDATKIADGSVTNTEFQYINTVTSNVQTQLNAKAASSHTHAATDVTSGTFADARIAETNVTQHEASLSITESQISDLQDYVVGPSSSTDNAIARFNTTTGKLVQNSTVIIDDNGAVTGLRTIQPANDLTWNLGSSSLKWNWIYSTRLVTQNGSAAQPGHSFSNDADCGMYLSTTNTVSFSTSGVKSFDIMPSGLLTVNSALDYETLVVGDDDIPNKKYVDDEISANAGSGDVTAASNLGAQSIVVGDDGVKGVKTTNTWTISNAGVLDSNFSYEGYILDVHNTKADGGGYGFRIMAGELLGDIAFHVADTDDTFQIMELEADQGHITFGKTYAQTLSDNGTVYGLDIQHSGLAKDFNTQNGTYRIAGKEVIVPTGGATGQILSKTDGNDYNMAWISLNSGAAVQTRRSTSYTLTTSYVDITFNNTDIETDSTVIEHDNTNTDRITIKKNGTYIIAYDIELDANNTDAQTAHCEAQVRLNDSSVINGSYARASAFKDGSIGGSNFHNHISNLFHVTVSDNDYITLQLKYSGVGTTHVNSTTLKIWSIGGGQGPQGPVGSGTNLTIEEGGVSVTNTPHSNLDFDGSDFNVTDNGDGSCTVALSSASGDVSGPGSSIDQGLVRFNGTTGKIIEGVGIRHYGASTTDPTSPTPQAGDKYYNTVINHEMCYDGTRNKWLSIAIIMEGSGRNGSTTAGTYYRRFNGMVLSAAQGPHVAKGTIIRIGYSTSSAVAHTFEVLVGGAVVTSLASGGAASAYSESIDADFNAGIMSSRNASGSSTTSNFQSTIYYKLRA